MSRKTSLIGCLVGLVLVAGTARGALIIDTHTGWNGTDSVSPFGYGAAAETAGQTFTVTAPNTVLKGFSFWINDFQDLPVTFAAYVYAWDGVGTKASGTALYTSGQQSTTNSVSFEQFSFNTGSLELAPGEYIAFLSTSLFGSTDSQGYGAARSTEAYSGGAGFYLNNDSNSSAWTLTAWNATSTLGSPDLVFTANLDEPVTPAIPEPSTLAVFSLCCASVMLVRSRRSRQITR